VHALEQRIGWAVLDLRRAIVGLGITVVGVFLGYWASTSSVLDRGTCSFAPGEA
jgi:hypothetical protein